MNNRFKNYQQILVILVSLFFSINLNGQPNILLIISDDLNTRIGPYMELNNHTPNLDRLADEGVRFTRTYCQYPLCGPSRASFMSGLYCETNGVTGNSHVLGSFRAVNPALKNHPSLAGFFRENGYYTGRVSKIYHMGVPGGIERGEAGGDDPDSWDYAYNVMGPETMSQGNLELLSPGNLHYGANFSRMILPDKLEETQTDYIAVSQAIAILENRTGKLPDNGTNKRRLKPDAPFFLGVGLVRPHVPLIAPENCFEPYPDEETEVPEFVIGDNIPEQALRNMNNKSFKMSEMQKQKTISAYMASVRFMDQQVGRLLDALDRLKIRDETIVIFISDHGYNLGEHDCWAKTSLWEGTLRVPMIISYPGYEKNYGTNCNSITELIDLYPTLTELCGLSDKQPEILQGQSLAGYILNKEPEKGESIAYSISSAKGATIRTERWRYTRWGEQVEASNEELYDHKNDPEEFENLVDNSDKKEILLDMRDKFELARKKAQTKIN
ncbi:MAG: sulfatase-like hydrolase/transferase [Draconibacterium sp.]|nr:sulfatase-like hydrolase/transferase [Draconibacterium sp.]